MRATIFVIIAFCVTCVVNRADAGFSTQQGTPPSSTPAVPAKPLTQEALPWLPGSTAKAQAQPGNATPSAQTYTTAPVYSGQMQTPNAQPLITTPPPAIPNTAQNTPPTMQAQPIQNTVNPQMGAQPQTANPNRVAQTSLVTPINPPTQAGTQQPPAQTPQQQSTQTQAAAATTNPQTTTPTPITRVTNGLQHLPNTAGQVWRTYDISPYTKAITNNPRPQQAMIDWILKETGKEIWFTEPMGILNASKTELHVYHTPAVQERILPLVDRFVKSQGQQIIMGLRMLTIGSPNWRASAISMMQPIDVQAPGIEAWLMTKENAAVLGGMLRSRSDYQERNSGDLPVVNGQQYTLRRTQPIELARSIGIVNDGVARYQPLMDRIEQGFTLDFSALNSLNGQTIDAIIGIEINQVEDIQAVTVDLPTANGQTQPYQLQIPQLVSWEIEERFRWPSNMVLVISCGVVATPGPQKEALFGLTSLINGTQGRADALMFVEYKGPARTIPGSTPNPATVRPPVGVAQQSGALQPPPRQ
ncbi:MAG: hypothetical protein P8J33_16095 [Pirellulaceae bacterium]|nr:hypothetical protein [Pirellulaceae bacterium]